MRVLPLIAAGLFALAAVPGAAQDAGGPDYKVEVEQKVFSRIAEKKGRNVRLVSLQFQIKKVRDDSIVTDVPREEIVVEEDGQKVAGLEVIQPKGQKLTLVLAMDVSGSMARGDKMNQARRAALSFLDRLDRRANVGLILFDHEMKVAEPPARNPADLEAHRDKLRGIIRGAQPQGGTAYLDATVRAVKMLEGIEGRRVVVLMTDGVDMNSKTTLSEAIQSAQAGELPVYTIGIGEPGKNDPVTTVLVLDRSGSMLRPADDTDRTSKIDALKRAARRFVELIRPGSKTTLLPFSSKVDSAEPFTDNKTDLKRRIDRLKAFGGTLLYDATYKGIETLVASDRRGKKAVVVLTDGKDEAPGSRQSDAAVIERAREVKIPLYMLGLGRPGELNEPVMRKMAQETGGEYYHAGNEKKLLEVFENLSIQLHDDGIDEASLKRLAGETGGKYTHVSKVSELTFIYEKLADELQSTYKVTYESRRAQHDGTARGIDVKVMRGGRLVSTVGKVDDVARGVAVPQMDYAVYLSLLAILLGLLAFPALVRRIYKGYGGV
jgi:VWFA-related protein